MKDMHTPGIRTASDAVTTERAASQWTSFIVCRQPREVKHFQHIESLSGQYFTSVSMMKRVPWNGRLTFGRLLPSTA